MYHPTRGGVRGGRDQFSWDDVKVDKHRENYLGHSIKAPVGRWQKGKDLHWYNKDKKTWSAEMDAAKDEIKRIKEEEDQAMREALGLAPKRANRAQGNRLDKHEFSELVKRGSTAEDLGEGHAEAAHVHGLGFSRAPAPWDDSTSLQPTVKGGAPEMGDIPLPKLPPKEKVEEESEDESSRRKRRREERKHEKHERREKRDKHEKRHSSDERKHRKDKEKRRHA
ncbi:putative kinase phosphorylation domain-containing protein [Rosa chinensis]|uniref:Putative kinase phosphorylation domain-containing protein n=1 Tax=Rosa chinensis TaxID=74649 RepID=A0A2P6PQC7_ROSCH|nr:multiple myeloma tumor-associated protein 2 homolog [Rosa chinensis]XP_040364138.1 multiple myeloma tumor-associated protein 2 homolog [Rosa chinensis]XP_040364139.1 multiple myeloma tumor-associated protein 2 homolog [Rosa chinensis]PRQ24143.1 putative kinase phosphorylation domain-containing protein [Rosa chinensis]